MSKINLIDEKAINVNGEDTKVLTMPNNEPIYRSNGHELELNGGNSDYLTIPYSSSTTIDEYSIKILYDVDSFQGITGYLFCKGFTDTQNDFLGSYITNTGILVLRINGVDRSLINFISLYTGAVEIEFRGSSTSDCEIYIDGELKISNPNRPNLQKNELMYINCLNPSNFVNTSTILGVQFLSETFNPTNINSNAQIVGSNGTIAQVNSSAADPINYILGTVFQKSGFALGLDAANSEYLLLPSVQTLSADGDYLEISFTLDSLGQQFAIVSEENVGDYLTILSDGRLFINTGSGNSLNTLVINDLDNIVRIERTATGLDVTLNGVTETSTLTTDFNYGQFFRRSSGYLSGKIHYIKSNLDNYPLRRGLGNKILKEGAEAVTALELVATNSDFVSAQFSNTTITETSDIDLEFEFYMDSFDGGRIRLFHFSDENGEAVNNNKAFWFETNTTRSGILFRQSNSDGSVNANAFNFGTPIIGLNTVKILNGEAFLNGVKTSSDPNNYTLDISNPYLKIARFYSSNSFTDLKLLGFKFKGESFSAQEINSSAQIIGSEGTVAQANTSAAGGTSYILDNIVTPNEATIISGSADADRINFGMWKENGNVLKLDSSNSDYVSLNTEASFTGDFFIEFDIDSKLDSNNQVLGINESGQTNISLFGGGKIFYNTDGQSAYLSAFGILPFTGRFKYKIERVGVNTFFYVDGVQVDTVNNQNGTFTLNRLFASFTQSFEGDVYSLNINGESYLLREGNGTTITSESGNVDATINTSAADPTGYINSNVWDVDSSKWIDYEKE